MSRSNRKADSRAGEPAALAAAAILRDPVELPLLHSLGVGPRALDALFDEGWLIPVPPAAARLSDKVDRAKVLDRLPWSERRRLHARAGEALATRPDRRLEAAEHFVAACRFPDARALLLREAESAARSQQFAAAADSLRQAVAIWPADEDPAERRRVLRELARSARNCGRHDLARDALSASLAMEDCLESDAAIDAHQQLADLAILEQDFPAARGHLEDAAAVANRCSSREEAARRWLALAVFLADQQRPADALAALRRSGESCADPLPPPLVSELRSFEAILCAMLGRSAEAKRLADESLALAVEHNLPRQCAIAYRRAANVRAYSGDYAGGRDAQLDALDLCRKSGEDETRDGCLFCLSYMFFRTAEWKRALTTTAEVLRRPDMHPAFKAGAQGIRSMISAFRGDVRHAVPGIDEAVAGLRRHGILSLEFHLLWARAFACAATGDSAAAAATFLRMIDLWDSTDRSLDVIPGSVSAAAFFADAGDRRRLTRVLDIVNAVVAAGENDEGRAGRLAVLAESTADSGDTEGAIAHLTAARDGYDRVGTPVEQALVRARLHRLLVAAGREAEAAAERSAGASIARAIGMRPLLAQLGPPGPEPGSPPDSTAHALTARQRDILTLLAAGLTNKEAADRLSLSPRTVEMHVAGVLSRLNCRTRASAVRRAAELGLLR